MLSNVNKERVDWLMMSCVSFADPSKMLPDDVCKAEAGHLLSSLAMHRPQIAEQVL